nr:MAG: capsid protein [Cressdnaviricota sp.]
MSYRARSNLVYKKTTPARKASTIVSKLASALKGRVQRLLPSVHGRGVRGEVKGVDYPVTSTSFTLNSAVAALPLNLTIAGSGYNQHIGNRIAMKSLQFTGAINTTGDQAEWLRVLIFYDKQTNGAAPIYSDVINSLTQAGASSSLANDYFNLQNRDRFQILRDHKYYMNSTTNGNGLSVETPTMKELMIEDFIPLKNLETCYVTAPNGAIGDVKTGGLFVIFQGSVGALATLNWSARLRFEDN